MMEYLNDKFSIIHRVSCINLDKRLSLLGISRGQASFLISVCEKEGQSQEQIAAKMQINKGAAARIFKQLEDEGYIKRYSCKHDKRRNCIFPTEKTKAIYEDMKNIMKEWDDTLLTGLTDLERSILLSLLDKVAGNISISK